MRHVAVGQRHLAPLHHLEEDLGTPIRRASRVIPVQALGAVRVGIQVRYGFADAQGVLGNGRAAAPAFGATGRGEFDDVRHGSGVVYGCVPATGVARGTWRRTIASETNVATMAPAITQKYDALPP